MSDPTRPARDDYPAVHNMAMYDAEGDGPFSRALDEIDTLRRLAVTADWLIGPDGIDPDVMDDVNTRSPFTYGALRGLEDAVREWRVTNGSLEAGWTAELARINAERVERGEHPGGYLPAAADYGTEEAP